MATNQTAQQTQSITQPEVQRHTIGDTFKRVLGATNSIIAAVDNTAKVAEHVTGTLADKAENWRDSSKIADAIEHNKLLAQLNQQAQELGIQSI